MHETSCTIWWINQSEHYLIKCECNFFPLRLYYHKFNMILLPQKPCHTWLRFYILLLKELLFFVLFCFVLRYIFLSFLSRKNGQKSYFSSKISPETNNTQFFYYEKVKILITFCFHSPYLYIFWLSSSIYHLLLQLLDRSAAIFTFWWYH